MEKSFKMQQIYYPFIIGLSLENRLAAFKECAELGLAICVRSLLFFNFLVAGKFKHVEKNAHHLLSEKSTLELILKETKSLKKWVKIVGNYHLVKYNILIGYLVENSSLFCS